MPRTTRHENALFLVLAHAPSLFELVNLSVLSQPNE